MKLNRITSLVAFALALLVVFAQLIGSVHAAPPSQISAVSVQLAPGAGGASVSVSKPASPADQTPYHLTVQGRLTDPNGNPITVATNITFKLYNFVTGGSPLYTEGPVSVTPSSNGLFTYLLGSNVTWNAATIALFTNKVYLGITVASDAEMTPRFEMTGSPYAYSLAAGAVITGSVNGLFPQEGTINGVNTNPNYFSIGVYGRGTTGLSGESFVDNVDNFGVNGYSGGSSASVRHTGVYGGANIGIGVHGASGGTDHNNLGAGVYGESFPSTNVNGTAGVIGFGLPGTGGVFTGTVRGLVGFTYGTTAGLSGYNDGVSGLTSTPGGSGLYGHSTGSGGEGVWGTALLGPSNDVGGFFDSYDEGASHTAIYARGAGHSTGGWFSPNGFGLMVKYDGTTDLHPGDVIALDGNNSMAEGSQVLGVVKADASNADAAIGIAQYRYQVYPADKSNPLSHDTIQVDDKATAIKSGDLMQIIIAGQTQVKVSGNVKVGDRLAIASDGSVAAAKDGLTIGKVAGKPDANGLVTVVVNFK